MYKNTNKQTNLESIIKINKILNQKMKNINLNIVQASLKTHPNLMRNKKKKKTLKIIMRALLSLKQKGILLLKLKVIEKMTRMMFFKHNKH